LLMACLRIQRTRGLCAAREDRLYLAKPSDLLVEQVAKIDHEGLWHLQCGAHYIPAFGVLFFYGCNIRLLQSVPIAARRLR